jgi:transposase
MTGKRRPNLRYTEGFKRSVVEEYLRSNHSQKYLENKHGILKRGAIRVWIRQLGYHDITEKASYLETPIVSLVTKKKVQPEESLEALQRRIKELERKLEDEQLRSEGYSRMIDIAEDQLKVSIRKKPDTK